MFDNQLVSRVKYSGHPHSKGVSLWDGFTQRENEIFDSKKCKTFYQHFKCFNELIHLGIQFFQHSNTILESGFSTYSRLPLFLVSTVPVREAKYGFNPAGIKYVLLTAPTNL